MRFHKYVVSFNQSKYLLLCHSTHKRLHTKVLYGHCFVFFHLVKHFFRHSKRMCYICVFMYIYTRVYVCIYYIEVWIVCIHLHWCNLITCQHSTPWPPELSPGPGRAWVTNTHIVQPSLHPMLCMPKRPSENSIERVVHGRASWRGKQQNSVFHAPACS